MSLSKEHSLSHSSAVSWSLHSKLNFRSIYLAIIGAEVAAIRTCSHQDKLIHQWHRQTGWMLQFQVLHITRTIFTHIRKKTEIFHKFWLCVGSRLSTCASHGCSMWTQGTQNSWCTSENISHNVCGTIMQKDLVIKIFSFNLSFRMFFWKKRNFCVSSSPTATAVEKAFYIAV